MAFYLKTFEIGANNEKGFTWYINQEKPELPPLHRIDYLQADGDELERIKSTFVNIPHCHRLTIWRGEWAEFIFENLIQIK